MCPAKAYPCPCCGYKTITKEPPGSYEICPICFWEDSTPDGSARFYTSNKITLIQAQRNFLSFGACAREWLTDVRPPKEEESRESDWQTSFSPTASISWLGEPQHSPRSLEDIIPIRGQVPRRRDKPRYRERAPREGTGEFASLEPRAKSLKY